MSGKPLGKRPDLEFAAVMNPNELFAQALPLGRPWIVTESRFEGKPKCLRLEVDVEPGITRLACPECGEDCPIHDRRERKWRHLNFWQYETELSARMPRVRCEKCGVHQVEAPWARAGSGFTQLFEAMALLLCKQMTVSEAAATMGIHDTRMWRIVRHYVEKAFSGKKWSKLKRVGMDEMSRRKGHRYVTNFVDLDTGHLLYMAEGKDAATVEDFASQLPSHQASSESVEEVSMDMSGAFQKGVSDHLPNAKKVFDRYHIMALAGEALDEVRKEVAEEVGGLGDGAVWALRGNAARLSKNQAQTRQRLCKEHSRLARALSIREFLAETWIYTDRDDGEHHLKAVVSWMARCRMEPFKRLARTIKAHWEGILDYYHHYTTNAVMESLHSKLQLAKRKARGYRNIEYFRAIAYWLAGDLKPEAGLPDPMPQAF